MDASAQPGSRRQNEVKMSHFKFSGTQYSPDSRQAIVVSWSSSDNVPSRAAESDSKVMIVTGGSRGIGAATARLAGQRGFRVCVNYLQNESAAESVVREIRDSGR